MGRKPGFRQSAETRAKIGDSIRARKIAERNDVFYFRVRTGSGIYFGGIEADILEEAGSRVRAFFEGLRMEVIEIEQTKRSSAGDTFFLPAKGTQALVGRQIWVDAGRREEYDGG